MIECPLCAQGQLWTGRFLRTRFNFDAGPEIQTIPEVGAYSFQHSGKFVQCLHESNYDESDGICFSGIGQGGKNGKDEEAAEESLSPRQVLDFIQGFVTTAYDMASALVDANTMNSIDFDRCMDDGTEDVCRLTYWRLPKYNKVSESA